MGFNKKICSCILLAIFVIPASYGTSSIANTDLAQNKKYFPLQSRQVPVESSNQMFNPSVSKSDKGGNVIFDDNVAFGPASVTDNRNKRDFATLGDKHRDFSNVAAGGYLQNHRLEGSLSPEVLPASAVVAATTAAISSNFIDNDSENSQRIHSATGLVADSSITRTGQGRTYHVQPSRYQNHHGWASNSGSCQFSCSTGSFGGGATCCQQNYVQCCPNSHQEQWNFQNLHHGRGYIDGGGGNLKGGYAWGSVPYNPPPIVKPNLCHPQPHPGLIGPPAHGGSFIHKGIETIKHNIQNIGHIFKKDHVHGGWGGGGNGASGYYFHRRADDGILEESKDHGINIAKKKRPARSVNNELHHRSGGVGQVVPCPVYSVPQTLGWHSTRPYSAGLGSLIGWARPGNQIHTGSIGVGGYNNLYQQHYQHGISNANVGYGWGWGGRSNICQLDHECPGTLRCCKGVCQVAPHN